MKDAPHARDEILARIRKNLAGAKVPPLPSAAGVPGSPKSITTPSERLDLFVRSLEAVSGRVHRVRSVERAVRAVSSILEETGAHELALSDGALTQQIARKLSSAVATFDGSADRTRCLRAPAGISDAQWGIAETGTLVLESDAERHRLVSLLCPLHIALLRASTIVGSLGDALAKVARERPEAMSRAVTFITGPSRTADIELTLVVGVHGPQQLHVVLLEEG
ncbi:MAG: lactate utilization protein [Planctomycetes bacterium]|nr:lactate utilization protein [Planctomycetota bacterium]